MDANKCKLCKEEIISWPNTGEPITEGKVCLACWSTKVVPKRTQAAREAAKKWRKNQGKDNYEN